MHTRHLEHPPVRWWLIALITSTLVLTLMPITASAEDPVVIPELSTTTEATDFTPLAEDEGERSVTISVLGVDDEGASVSWLPATTREFTDAETAWEATDALLTEHGIEFVAPASEYGIFLDSITKDGVTLGSAYDSATGEGAGWTFYLNGEMAAVGASSYVLATGDVIEWRYETYSYPPVEEEKEEPASIVPVDPDAPHPSHVAQWPQFAKGPQGSVINAPTATTDASLAWLYETAPLAPGDGGFSFTSLSDPLMVDGKIFLFTASGISDSSFNSTFPDFKLVVLDATTGEVLKTMAGKDTPGAAEDGASPYTLAAPIDSTSRPAYHDGVIIAPLQGGRLQAIAADSLTTLWVTPELTLDGGIPETLLSSTLIADGKVFVATTSGWGNAPGALHAFDFQSGEKVWSIPAEQGYYWSGACMVAGFIVIIGDDGELLSVDPQTGAAVDSHDLGVSSRSGVTVVDESSVVFTTTDGVLYIYSVGADGGLTQQGSVILGTGDGFQTSTNKAAVHGGRAFVGGMGSGSEDEPGLLAIVDLGSMEIEKRIALPAGVQSSPLASVVGQDTFIYFMVNTGDELGGVYVYKLGDERASQLYLPEARLMNWSTSSLVASEEGMLYFSNDSGTLFALEAATSSGVVPDESEEDNSPTDQGTGSTTKLSGGSTTEKVDTRPGAGTPKTGDEFPWTILGFGAAGILIMLIGGVILARSKRR